MQMSCRSHMKQPLSPIRHHCTAAPLHTHVQPSRAAFASLRSVTTALLPLAAPTRRHYYVLLDSPLRPTYGPMGGC